MITRLLLFGATGDLAGRFLLPALAKLRAAGKLPDHFRIVASARQKWGDETFRRHAAERLARHASDVPAAERDALVRALHYRASDFGTVESVARLVRLAASEGTCGGDAVRGSRHDDQALAAYLALPSALFAPAVKALGAVGLPTGSRIVLEKPFGYDLNSAVELNALLTRMVGVAGEEAIFRVDHFLGMATVQNLLGVRLSNRVLEPVWNSAHIERIEILWDETLALEGRASYYDRTGALKDMIQNHLLQILCLIAMEPPVTLSAGDLRDRKLDVLRSVRPLTEADVVSRTRRARYAAGRLATTGGGGGEAVPSYVEEEGVDPGRNSETFAEISLELDNWRWSGTRFVLRTGKALARERKEAVVRFRPVPGLPFGGAYAHPAANELRIGLEVPHDLTLCLTGSAAGSPPRLAPLILNAHLCEPELPAYSRVLMDVLNGDSTLSIRADEAEQAWRILAPVLRTWADGRVPLEEYPAGSNGPTGRSRTERRR